jgi:hypothetical protein
MVYHLPERKTEKALKLLFQNNANCSGLAITTRYQNATVTEPCLSIFAEEANPAEDPAEILTGNWNVTISLEVRSNADVTSGTTHDTYVGVITDALMDTGITATLNGYMTGDGFTAFDAVIGKRTNRVEDRSMVTTQYLTVYMMPQ